MSFVSETQVKAVRKAHPCDGCGDRIEIGEPAARWAGMSDGSFATAIYHVECRAAEVALNEAYKWSWGDDWIPLCDYDDDDREWLLATFPEVAARLGIAAPAERDSPAQSVTGGGKPRSGEAAEHQSPAPDHQNPIPGAEP